MTGKSAKPKPPKAKGFKAMPWIAGVIGLLLGLTALLYMQTGQVLFLGGICHSRTLPVAWIFDSTGKARLIPGLTCDIHGHPGPNVWQPINPWAVGFDKRGMCNRAGRVYSLKQGTSALNGDFRLDITQADPFYWERGTSRPDYLDRKSYCTGDTFNSRTCQVQLMPVCVEPGKPGNTFGIVGSGTLILTPCGRNDLRQEVGVPHDDYEQIAGFALAEEKAGGNVGFRYAMSSEAGGIYWQTVVVTEEDYGYVHCYYENEMYVNGHAVPATVDDGINRCMEVLADRNRYCDGDGAMPSPNVY